MIFFGSLRPKIIELKEKYEFIEQELIEELLVEGNKKGIFQLDDPKIASKSFHLAFSTFLPPLSFQNTEEELMEGVKNMANLLLNGLLVRGSGYFFYKKMNKILICSIFISGCDVK